MARQAPATTEHANGATPAPIAQPTSPDELRARRKGRVYRLPGSGLCLPLIKPNLIAIALRAGMIPNKYHPEIVRYLVERDDVLATPSFEEQLEHYRKNARAFIEMLKLCLAGYTIVEDDREPDYDNHELHIDDFANRDLTWIVFEFILGEAETADRFLVAGSA
jgi:hypothetical protein